MIKQYEPPEDCVTVLLNNIKYKNICKGDRLYEELIK